MDIERVNDSTIKFFITYKDIEDRGFERDEIWYNRERGEELFFEMMNEVNDRDEFVMDGPLWIQVHALDKGLEIVVTRGQIADGHVKLEIPVSKEEQDLQADEDLGDMVDDEQLLEDPDHIELIIGFADIEDVISLSHCFDVAEVENSLYVYEGTYYLHTLFHYDRFNEDEQDDMLSQMLEFGYESDLTIHRIEEYGQVIITEHALSKLKESFSKR